VTRAAAKHHEVMQISYGVVWREGSAPLSSGKLEVRPRAIRLEGLDRSSEIPYEGLASVRVGRSAGDRIDGRPSLVLERRTGEPISIATVAQPSLLGEIVDQVVAHRIQDVTPRRVALVLPIEPGSHDAVRELLAGGPPFDPDEIPGLERHEVFLTADEVVFTFDADLSDRALDALVAAPELWSAAVAWREHIAGPPRLAESAFSWLRAAEPDELSSLPTPGPGDSDGGDIY
jgi:hypothetical protein